MLRLRRFGIAIALACTACNQAQAGSVAQPARRQAPAFQLPHRSDSDKAEASGYTVTIDVNVTAAGAVESAELVESDSSYLGRVALRMVRQMTFNPRVQDGAAVPSVQRVPLFFPVDGDAGADAARPPVPALRVPAMPTYPFEMARNSVPGGAHVHLQIDDRGQVKKLKVLRASAPEFGRACEQTLKNWKFSIPKDKVYAAEFTVAVAFEVAGRTPEWKWYVAPRPAMKDAFVVSAFLLPLRN